LIATASGPQASEALTALQELAREGFGEGVTSDAAPQPAAPRPEPEPEPPAEAPSDGALLRGIPASPGIALGAVQRLDEQLDAPPERAAEGADAEWQRLESARHAARSALERDRDQVARRSSAAEAAIFG